MSPRGSKTIDLALLILPHIREPPQHEGRTLAVQLALRVLVPYVDHAHLLSFWTILENENPRQRLNKSRRPMR